MEKLLNVLNIDISDFRERNADVMLLESLNIFKNNKDFSHFIVIFNIDKKCVNNSKYPPKLNEESKKYDEKIMKIFWEFTFLKPVRILRENKKGYYVKYYFYR